MAQWFLVAVVLDLLWNSVDVLVEKLVDLVVVSVAFVESSFDNLVEGKVEGVYEVAYLHILHRNDPPTRLNPLLYRQIHTNIMKIIKDMLNHKTDLLRILCMELLLIRAEHIVKEYDNALSEFPALSSIL